jgi:DNA-binding transcriptional LysR family regulator
MKSGLAELTAVLAVAQQRNFRAAAGDLGMSRSALSHAVSTFEQRIGVRLFHRTTRSVSLTQAGEQFVASVSPALRQIDDALAAAASRQVTPAGALRIHASVTAALQLWPIFEEYTRRYPTVHLDVATDGRFVDIVRKGFDAGVRLAESVPKDMIAILVGRGLLSEVPQAEVSGRSEESSLHSDAPSQWVCRKMGIRKARRAIPRRR